MVADAVIAGFRHQDDSPTSLSMFRDSLAKLLRGEIPEQDCQAQAVHVANGSAMVQRACDILLAQDSPPPATSSNWKFPSPPSHRRNWTHEEDIRLLSGVLKHGILDWSKVAACVGNGRVRGQCAQRWFRGLDPVIRREKWTPEEDLKLMQLVQEIGSRNWMQISKHMQGRNDVQCRYRYHLLLKPHMKPEQITEPMPEDPKEKPPTLNTMDLLLEEEWDRTAGFEWWPAP
jgi:hypothetical protein